MNLTPEQYAEMVRRYPGIESYLARCQVHNEYRHLLKWESKSLLNDWQTRRLADLREMEQIFGRSLLDDPATN
jgi:hypothetical protein